MHARHNLTGVDEVYKSVKLNADGDAKGKGRATVEDADDDEVAGPVAPPDEDEAEADDEEGRFFGGGITNGTAEILDFIDGQDDEEAPVCSLVNWARMKLKSLQVEKIDAAWLRKLALNFEKRISKNAELRAKFQDEPQK